MEPILPRVQTDGQDGRVTIHSHHPFLDPEGDRRVARRLRGRMPAPVTVWASTYQGSRAGLTVSSLLVADGEPARLVGLLDEESELWPLLRAGGLVAVSVLGPADEQVADVFAGLTPSPGGTFRTGHWVETGWGPVLTGRTWAGARLAGEVRATGWSLLVDLTLEQVEFVDDAEPNGALAYRRGRYLPIPDRG